MKIYAIDNGKVSAHIKDPNFNQYLPVIPSEVSSVNFTWKSGPKKYDYNFDRLQSLDESILKPPTLSIKIKGRIPQEPKGLFIQLHIFDRLIIIIMKRSVSLLLLMFWVVILWNSKPK